MHPGLVSPNTAGDNWGPVETLGTVESSHSITLALNHSAACRQRSQPSGMALSCSPWEGKSGQLCTRWVLWHWKF